MEREPKAGPDSVWTVDPVVRIRVTLSTPRGRPSFSDLDGLAHIHTFTDTFSGTLVPFINATDYQPLKVLPVELLATVQQHDEDDCCVSPLDQTVCVIKTSLTSTYDATFEI